MILKYKSVVPLFSYSSPNTLNTVSTLYEPKVRLVDKSKTVFSKADLGYNLRQHNIIGRLFKAYTVNIMQITLMMINFLQHVLHLSVHV